MQAAPLDPSVATKPVLKWAGGKRKLAPRIVAQLPERIHTYFEPFLGSAAVFFHLAATDRFEHAVLADSNGALMDVYVALKKDVDRLLRVLEQKRYRALGEEEYYSVRALDPAKLDCFERAARTIYLNKTGYNGLYRQNRSGQFNVPFGRYKKPTIYKEATLRAAAAALGKAKLVVADFEKVVANAGPGDAVYFDPPYVPVSRTAYFTSYAKEAFGEREHERLAEVFGELSKRRVQAVLSNSDTEWTRQLYRSWKMEHLVVPRPINSNASKRGGVGELLVANIRRRKAAARK
jgi:DNA adenine methylase